jgi:hypothetical protein
MRTFVTSASPYTIIVMMLGISASFTQVVIVGLAFGIGRSIGPIQAVLAEEAYWSEDLSRTARPIERSGSVFAAAVAVAAALVDVRIAPVRSAWREQAEPRFAVRQKNRAFRANHPAVEMR